jgi:hypothetical protein
MAVINPKSVPSMIKAPKVVPSKASVREPHAQHAAKDGPLELEPGSVRHLMTPFRSTSVKSPFLSAIFLLSPVALRDVVR